MINKSRLIDEFCTLVEIDSLSYHERNMAEVLKKSLAQLGFEVKEDDAGSCYGRNSGNLYGYLPGQLEGEPLLFSAHMDTVEPGIHKKAVVHQNGKITSEGNTVLGADDISGIVSILEALRTIKENGIPHRSIEVLFTIAEEVYIRGSEVFDYSIIKSKEAYVLDLSGAVGSAALAAPTLISFTAEIQGIASHAGFSPELGINAIAIAAEAVSKIKQGRIDQETTVNIGLIQGGTARNIVSEHCILRGEVRSMSHDKALSEAKHMESIFSQITAKYSAKLTFSTEIGCISYKVEKEHPVVNRFLGVCYALGYHTHLTSTFGGSDNNNFMRHGITGIVIACGMNQVHSCSEYSHIDELVKCSTIVLKLMTEEENNS
jgi:tripeptide aminopeptidase